MPQQESEIKTFVQNDFSGGVNIVDDPVKLAENELSDARNLVIYKTDLRQRYGYTLYNSSAIGASTGVRSAFQFRNKKGDQHLVVQADDGKIYLGSAAVPTVGSFSALLTESASPQVACFTEVDHKLIMTNGVDPPQVYEGTYGRCEGFAISRDGPTADVVIIMGESVVDYELEVVDEDTSTTAFLGSLGTRAVDGDRIYIGSKVPTLTGFRIVVGTGNTEVSAMSVRYFSGTAWVAVSDLVDGTRDTATLTKTLNQTGDINFTAATTHASLLGSQYRYWFMVTLTAALSATTKISGVYLKYPMQDLPLLWNGTFQYVTQFVKTVDAGVNFTDYTANVIDSDADTAADLSSLDTYANGDYFFIGYSTKFTQIWLQITAVNTNASVLTAEYWNGIAWTALTISDGTQDELNGKTFSNLYTTTMAPITFVLPTDWLPAYIPALAATSQFFIRFKVSAALSADVKVAEARVIPYLTPLGAYRLCLGFKERLFLGAPIDELNRIEVSADSNINDFDGADADSLYISSNLTITTLKEFYNEIFVSTSEEIILIQGYSPTTFSLLRIETDKIGSLSQPSVVSWGKTLFFIHSSGFYVFDGTGVQNISKDKINPFFDSIDSTYFIPLTRLPYVQGRWNPVDKVVEWTVSKGSSQATNNFIITFNPEKKAWMFHDFVACSMMNLIGSNGETQAYHGDYSGRIHQANVGALDNSTAITSYLTTRGFSGGKENQNLLCAYKGLQVRAKGQSSGVLVVDYTLDGLTDFSSFCTLSMVSSNSFVWMVYHG